MSLLETALGIAIQVIEKLLNKYQELKVVETCSPVNWIWREQR